MDLNFGHGFIPRIGSQNYKAVDRCLGPDSLFGAPVELPWAIVDAPWAEKNQEYLASLHDHGTRVLLDDSGWRYRYTPTFEVATMAKASWAPDGQLLTSDSASLGRYVRETLRCQAKLGANAYLVPGFMPDDKHEDLRPTYDSIASIVGAFDELPPKPLIMFVGAHSAGLALAHALIDGLPGFLSGVYLQVGPYAPVTDSPTKLLSVTQLFLHAKSLGVSVIGGRAGAVTPALRAAGIDAGDAGLACGETFTPVRDIVSGCRLACHRFIGGDDFLARAKEHSLRARVAEAQAIAALPPSMRLAEMTQRLTLQRSTITSVNAALLQAGITSVDTRPTDNHLNWLSRVAESRSAA